MVEKAKTHPTRKPITPAGLMIMLGAAIANQVAARQEHAIRCKKNPDECEICAANRKYFDQMSPRQISISLENPQARGFRQTFKNLIYEGARKNWDSDNKRGEASFHAAVSLAAYHKAYFPEQYPKN